MEIVPQLAKLLDTLGAAWVLWLLLILSVLSVAVVVERLIFLQRHRVPVDELQRQLLGALDKGPAAAEEVLKPWSGMPAVVVRAGVREMRRGAQAVEELMAAREKREKVRYERFVAFLGSLGSNAPFIGLLGTVIGIMGAFADLRNVVGEGTANRSEAIMGSISEALVATAVGLIVAIPAVVAYNALKVQIKKVQTDTASLAAVLLAHLKSTPRGSDETDR